jgi:RNA-directed DNA polymerase
MPQKQLLEKLFDAMYHGKRSFHNFANVDVLSCIERQKLTRFGKTREVLIPNDELKGYHEFIRLFLLDFMPLNEQVVFSYRKRFSAYDAVIPHAKNRSFFVCDIGDFFPNLKRARIQTTVATAREQCPVEDFDRWFERIIDLVCVEDSLPQGFSTSPTISNAALNPFDTSLQSLCQQRNLVFTRYSDDIIISGQDITALKEIKTIVETTLNDSMGGEFTLHPAKSKLLHRGIKIKLLGMVLLPNGKITIDSEIRSEIEVLVHFYLSDSKKFAARFGGNTKKAEARLAGLLNYANAVDQEYLDKLRKKFGATVIDFFIHRSFS